MTQTLWQILYWSWVASEFGLLIVTRTRRSTGETRDRGSLLLLWPVIFLSIFFAMTYGFTHPHTIGPWARPAAIAILVIGLIIRWTAIISLGRSFSVNVAIHATQTIYKRGLFAIVRHPSYTGLLLVFVATGLNTRNLVALVITLVPTTLALLYRIHVEELALTGAFGDDYAAYSRSTKRLIPGIF